MRAASTSPCDHERARLAAGRVPEGDPSGDVERELGDESCGQDREGAWDERDLGATRDPQHEHGADGVGRAHDVRAQPARVAVAVQVLGQRAEGEPEDNQERHGGRRRQEQHRHEDELRRDGEARAHLEPHPGGEGVAGDQHRRRDGAVAAHLRRAVGDNGHRKRERHRHRERAARLPPLGRHARGRASTLDERVVIHGLGHLSLYRQMQ